MTKSVNTALRMWPIVLGMLIVIAINRLEHWLFPVVTDFTITEMQTEGTTIKLSGYMRKDRNCTFAGVSAKAKHQDGNYFSIPLVFNDKQDDHTNTRPTGTQEWGPWSVKIPVKPSINEVKLSSVHQCHAFWTTTSSLITFPIIKGES